MDETELISGLQSLLQSKLGIPVKTASLEDERPVPVVIIDDWDTRDMNFNNSALAGEAFGSLDGNDADYERYLNFNFETRVEFLFRHSDEVDVSRLKEDGKQEMRLLRENPQQFNDGLKEVVLGADGNPTHEFTEPKEAELMLSVRFHGDHTLTRTPSDTQYDTIQDVQDDFTFNPN
jgi:hypothetical protein